MKQELIIGALLLGGALAFSNISHGHGGTYRGPGDTVPPGGGGGGSGGSGGPGTGTPGPNGPSNPGGSAPTTPGPPTPGNPPGGGGGSKTPITAGPSGGGLDLASWQFWWGFSKDPYLNLKAKLHDYTQTGSDVFFLGHGTEAEAKDSRRTSENTIRNKIVPALIDALENSTNNDILTGSMIALAKIGDAKDLEGDSAFETIIAKFLDDSVQEVRETAATALGILANPKSIPTLEHLALDSAEGRALVGNKQEVNFRTRAFAIYGLGLVGHRAGAEDRHHIVDTLARIIAEKRMSTRDVKVAAIIAMGLVPIDNLESSASESDPTHSRTHQISYLLDFLEDDHNSHLIRAHAPHSIALLLAGAPEGLREKTARVLLTYTGRNASKYQRELRQSATLALGQIGNCDGDGIDKKIHQALLKGTSESDQQAKFFSLIALAQTAGRGGDPDAPFGTHAESVLKATRKHLGYEMAKGGRAKSWAALSLGVLGHSLVQDEQSMSLDISMQIRSATERITSPSEIGAYALAAGLRKDHEAIKLLTAKLGQISDDEARGHIAIGLGLMDARSSIKQIQAIVEKSKYRPDLLKQAAIALGLLGDKDTVPALIEMLKEAKSLATQAAVAQALGFIGDSRSVAPLTDMLADTQVTPRARAFAAVALGIVADKELYPWNSKISVDINYRANTPTLTGGGGTGLLDIL